jgi:hypothetical protein
MQADRPARQYHVRRPQQACITGFPPGAADAQPRLAT